MVPCNQLLKLNSDEIKKTVRQKQAAKKPDIPQTKVTISKTTTYITAPLDELGFVNYEQAINDELSAGVNPERNAYVYYLQAESNLKFYQGKNWEPDQVQLFENYLGKKIPPGPAGITDLHDFISASMVNLTGEQPDFKIINEESEKLDQQAKKPWNQSELPKVKAYLDQISPALDMIKQGTQLNDFYAPILFEQTSSFSFRPYYKFRRISEAFICRMMLNIGEHNQEAALDDLLTYTRFSRDLSRSGNVIHQYIAASMERSCYTAGLKFIQQCQNEKMLRKYYEVLENLPKGYGMAKSRYVVSAIP
jgi:hypothetical protein